MDTATAIPQKRVAAMEYLRYDTPTSPSRGFMSLKRLVALMAFAATSVLPCLGQSYLANSFVAPPANGNFTSNIIQASDGNFYVGQFQSGYPTLAQVVQITPTGATNVIYTLSSSNSSYTDSILFLLQGVDGNLYGDAVIDGTEELFSLSLAGTFTAFAVLPSTQPLASLVLGSDGNIYGTTAAVSEGTFFSFNLTSHTLTKLYTFNNLVPQYQIMQASDGNFYGIAQSATSQTVGAVIYRISSSGLYTQLVETSSSLPYLLQSGISEAADNFFYGFAENESTGLVSVYKFNLFGAEDIVATLPAYTTGTSGGLTIGSDGHVYGLTLYNYDEEGADLQDFTTGKVPASFVFSSDSAVNYPLLLGSDSNFYLVDSVSYSEGIMRLTPQIGASYALPSPVQLSVSPSPLVSGSTGTLSWKVLDGPSDTADTCFASGDWSGKMADTGTVSKVFTAGLYNYALTCGGTNTTVLDFAVSPANPVKSATSVAVSPATGSVGTTLGLTSTVKSTTGSGPVPTGWIRFAVNGYSIARAKLGNGGSATAQILSNYFPAGPSQITALYSGDGVYAASSSASSTVELTTTPTITAVVNPTSVGQGQPVTLSVALQPVNYGPTPTGTVSLTGLFSGTWTLSNGKAVGSITAPSNFSGGSYVDINYSGDANYSSAFADLDISVLPAASVTLSASPTQVVEGSAVTLTANVAKGSGSNEAPSGSVTFRTTGITIGSAVINNGSASFTASSAGVSPGGYPVTATYNGDAYNGIAASSPITVTVSASK